MGFRKDSYATIWEVKPTTNTITKARITTSKKDKFTDQYVTDFSGWITFIGTACATAGAKLQARQKIKLGDVEVTNVYDKEKKITYTNFNVFNFTIDNQQQAAAQPIANTIESASEPQPVEDSSSSDLPF